MPTGSDRSLLGDRYRLDERVGIGRLTESWSGYDTRLDRDVTIRIVRPDLKSDRELVSRLASRLREASRLELAGLARIYDMIDDDLVAVVTEPADGPDLRSRIVADGPFIPEIAVGYARDLAATLEELHSRGVSHGGLTSAGVAWGADGRLMITDLGTGGEADAVGDETVTGDVTALASVVHEMVTGKPPHRSGGRLECDPSVPVELAGCLHDALTGPGFTTPTALAEALDTAKRGDVRPVTLRTTERRWLVPAAMIVGVGILLATVGSLLSRTEAGRNIIEGARDVVGLPAATTSAPTTTSDLPLITTTTLPPADVAIVQVVDFDPEGDDRQESPRRLVLINDGDPSRGWQTERYNSPDFGNLKTGVGLIVDVEPVLRFEEIAVRSPSRGWSMELYISDEPSAVVDDWGDPVATATNITGDVVFDDLEQGGRSLLIWITRLDAEPEHRVVVTDIEVAGVPVGA